MRLYLMSSFDLCGNHHAIEQASRRWRGGRRFDSARTRRKILISTQAGTPRRATKRTGCGGRSRRSSCLATTTACRRSASAGNRVPCPFVLWSAASLSSAPLAGRPRGRRRRRRSRTRSSGESPSPPSGGSRESRARGPARKPVEQNRGNLICALAWTGVRTSMR